jgi:hypothetical protein
MARGIVVKSFPSRNDFMRLPTVRRRTEGIHQRTSRDGRCIVYICSIQNATGKYPLGVEESPNSLAAAERLFW